jgi:cardiolipin synthase
MTALGFLIVGDAAPTAWFPVMLVGQVGLWVAALLTLITGYDYLAEGLKHVGEEPPQPQADERPKAAKPARPIL